MAKLIGGAPSASLRAVPAVRRQADRRNKILWPESICKPEQCEKWKYHRNLQSVGEIEIKIKTCPYVIKKKAEIYHEVDRRVWLLSRNYFHVFINIRRKRKWRAFTPARNHAASSSMHKRYGGEIGLAAIAVKYHFEARCNGAVRAASSANSSRGALINWYSYSIYLKKPHSENAKKSYWR